MNKNASNVATILDEYGMAARMDMMDITGKIIESDMHLIGSCLLRNTELTLNEMRERVGLCGKNLGRWCECIDNCTEDKN